MNEQSPPSTVQDDEISLLDLALTVAENLRLLIIAPIAVGLAAFGVSSFVPKTFESRAVLSVPSESLKSIRVPRGVAYCVGVSRYTSRVGQGRR